MRAVQVIRWVVAGLLTAVLATPIGLHLAGWTAAEVISGSMAPTIPVGGIAVVAPDTAVAVGDVAVVHGDGDVLFAHRVMRIDGETLITRGDANATDDRPHSTADVAGTVVAVLQPWTKALFGAPVRGAGVAALVLLTWPWRRTYPAGDLLVLPITKLDPVTFELEVVEWGVQYIYRPETEWLVRGLPTEESAVLWAQRHSRGKPPFEGWRYGREHAAPRPHHSST